MNKRILLVKPPKNWWADGLPVCKGVSEASANKTAEYFHKNGIRPNQDRLQNSFKNLKKILRNSGKDIEILDFPKKLLIAKEFDGVFIRDVGMCFDNLWIKANFSFIDRQIESDIYAEIIKKKFNKEIIQPSRNSYIEFGEVYYVEAVNGRFYFGGVSRANKQGHDFMKEIIKPDYFYIIKSDGYHLDTVFTPVLDSNNKLVALITSKGMLANESWRELNKIGIKIINVDPKDTANIDGLGNYAVNALPLPGVLITGAHFQTPGVEDLLQSIGVKVKVVDLPDYNMSGGSVHCLTNEIY